MSCGKTTMPCTLRPVLEASHPASEYRMSIPWYMLRRAQLSARVLAERSRFCDVGFHHPVSSTRAYQRPSSSSPRRTRSSLCSTHIPLHTRSSSIVSPNMPPDNHDSSSALGEELAGTAQAGPAGGSIPSAAVGGIHLGRRN
jgi:hypothetical protein